jgi:uncharacterized protein YndB with AHSA1/START domain
LVDNTPAIKFSHQSAEGFTFEVQAEDGTDGVCLRFVDDQLLVFRVIAEGHGTPGPFAVASGCRELVPDAFGRQLPLKLGKGQQDVQGEAAHGGSRVELLGDGDERDRPAIEGFDQPGEIRQGPGQAVDLVDHHDVDLGGFDIGQELL